MKLKRAPIAILVSLAAVSARADWRATGRFQYTDRTYNLSGFTGTVVLPIREADFQVYDIDTLSVLGQGATNADGEFDIQIVDASTRNVGVRVLASTTQTPILNMRVVDDQSGSAVFAFASASPAMSHDPAVDHDFGDIAAPAAIGPVGSTDWSSQVFNAFDMMILVADWIAALEGARPPASLTIGWNPTQGRGGSFYNGGSNRLSLADDDGYDDPNIVHEIGHWVEDEYGRSRNTGGTHFLNDDDQDPRLSFSEGFATYVSNATLRFHGLDRPDIYSDRDSFGVSGGGGFAYQVESAFTGGATNEQAVTAALYDLIDDAATLDGSPGVDDDPLSGLDASVWAVLREMRARNLPATQLEDFWDIWFDLGLGNQSAMESVFAAHSIDFFPDPFEPNDAVESAATLAVGAAYVENTFYRPGAVAAGDEDWFKFTAVADEYYAIEIDGAANTIFGRPDPQMFLMDADLNTAIAFNDDPLDTTLGTQSSSTAQDMRETVPAILWRAPAAGDYYVMTRHATFARNVGGRYGTYQIRVRNLAAPTPTVNSVAVQRMLPGESYQALVLGADFSVGATVSTSHVDLAATEVNWVGREALVVRFDAGAGLADGGYDLTVANPGGGSDSLVGALDVSAAAQPPIFITELALGNPDRVEVRNFGTQTATLTGWSIQSFSPGASPQVFTFPAFTLGAGGTVVISESGGTNTATELFDTGPPFNWPWDNGVEGDVSLLDDGGRNVDYIRFASDPIALQRAPIGTGAGWMQPDVSVPLAPLMIARDEDAALYRTAYGLSGAASTMPNGAAGRTNAVDPYEDNDSPRRAPLFGRNASIPDLAISPRGSAPADRDWFGIVVPPGDEVNVEAVFSHAGGDIDVELYAPTDETTPILVAESTTDDETIALTSAMTTANGGGVYKLHVYGFGGATNSYALELSQALRPGVTVEQAAGQADPTGSLPILFDVTFDEDVTGFDDPASDVVMGGAASGVTFGINPISASVYQIVVTAVVTDGTIVPSVPAGAAQNAAMLDNRASTSVDNSVTYDATPPTVVSVGVVAPGVVDVAFDDLMGTSALSTASYSISGAGRGSLGLNPDGVTTVAATTYRLTWLAGEMLTGGDVTIDVAGVQNRLGLAMGSPSSGADLGGGLGVAPTVLSANVQTGSSVDVTFSEPMGPTAEDRALYVISGTGRGALAASPDSAVLITSSVARLTWLGGEMFDGGNLTVALGAVRDLVGNVLGSPNTATHVGGAIGVRPTVASVAVVAARQVDVTFDEPMGAGALTPSNYTVSGLGAGSLSAAPDSVVSIGGSTYRLSWSAGTMAQGGDVTIAVASGAADPAGNPIGSPNQGTALGGGIATPSAARHWIVYR